MDIRNIDKTVVVEAMNIICLLHSAQEKLSDMKHVSSVMKESVWVDDRNIAECQQCKTTFSVARRKVGHTHGGLTF